MVHSHYLITFAPVDRRLSIDITDKNMYDEDGRIGIACKAKAKYMISLHTADEGYSGIEVYMPNNSSPERAINIANNIFGIGCSICGDSCMPFMQSNTSVKIRTIS